jgi:hypothetical protein
VSSDQFERRVAKAQEATWVREMKEHYTKTGTYRPQDLRCLLGDPSKGVEMGSRGSVSRYFADKA